MENEFENNIKDLDILVDDENLVSFSQIILKSNDIQADENGMKYVQAGSFIDCDGRVVREINVLDDRDYMLSSTPIGVVPKTIDVTNEDVTVSIIVKGCLRADMVIEGKFDNTFAEIKGCLPGISYKWRVE